MSRHRAEVRPRYGRIGILGSSLAVTLVAVLGGTGILPSTAHDTDPRDLVGRVSERVTTPDDRSSEASRSDSRAEAAARPEAATPSPDPARLARPATALPSDSGKGKRVVFSESRQRVWLVDEREQVVSTYAVSGSVYDNLDPGTFEVYSRSEDATGIDDSGTMKYFVRFTQGDAGAAIGFHDIPVLDGKRVQSVAELGTPLSHGCIRQRRSDALRLWRFAPIGTTVVVTS
ncbi:L,D-transpeptidase [Nocardioides sp. cx-169]|uniref:L,D-transpeptidase n=1 Tax=Nocardioides sp. cx-169 TaxID=2899080 RepID=UPI001E365D87|nr:L,D-transpeptidase [Nocardioides sp. cx-169]MCD4534185.1 L,D-transpeptidase [Nocardioides sp. cx-169]